MYKEILWALLPIILCMGAGYGIGNVLLETYRRALCRAIGPVVLLLLFAMGMDFGGVLQVSGSGVNVITHAMVYALVSTFVIGGLVVAVFGVGPRLRKSDDANESGAFLAALKECFVALAVVGLGCGISHFVGPDWHRELSLGASILLYVIIVMIGIDISGIRLAALSLTRRIFVIPLLVILGSMTGGAVGSLLIGDPLNIGLALTSGFGWFSMSGALIGRLVGSSLGAVALLTDLFRELLAIIILYLAGNRLPGLGVAASGAAAMDSTLPIIRKTCSVAEVSTALVSGFALTILGPVLIAFFASIG